MVMAARNLLWVLHIGTNHTANVTKTKEMLLTYNSQPQVHAIKAFDAILTISPSKTSHFGSVPGADAKSLIMQENRPSFHSRVLGLMQPKSSSVLTAFGSKSL